MYCQAEQDTLTESRRHSQANQDDNETDEAFVNTLASLNIEVENQKANKSKIKSSRKDITLLMIIGFPSWLAI